MKSSVQTRIFLSLTPEEARAAVNNAIDLQLCVRSALYQIDGTPVTTLIEQNRKQLVKPKRDGHRKPAARRECVHCHKEFTIMGIGKYEKACKAVLPVEVAA
jgi:hypothetical protein